MNQAHNLALLDAAASLRQGQKVDWETLVQWSRLPVIRADLDLLPQPSRSSSSGANRNDIDVPGRRNVFRYDDMSWTLTYLGKTVGKPHSVGLFYIRQLLASPGTPIRVEVLRQAYAVWYNAPSSPVRKRSRVATIACDHERESDEGSDALNASEDDLGDELDSVGRQEVARRIKELDDLIKSLKAQGKTAQADEHECERQFLEQRLNSSRVPGGGASKIASARRNVKNAVCSAIRRELNRLQDIHPALYHHLDRSLKVKAYCCYAPETPTTWNE